MRQAVGDFIYCPANFGHINNTVDCNACAIDGDGRAHSLFGKEAAMERRNYVWKNVSAISAMLALALMPSFGGGGAVNPTQNVASARSAKTPAIPGWHPHFDQLPILFEPNVGQAAAPIEYLARSNGFNVAVTEQGITLSLRYSASSRNRMAPVMQAAVPGAVVGQEWLRMSLIHSRAHTPLRAEQKQESVSNYFIGNDHSKWHSNVANYAAVRREQVYPGIDWVLYANQHQLEYDFRVAPHANPERIKLRIEGADRLSIDGNGDLLVRVGTRSLRQLKPAIYQIAADGEKREIEGGYRLEHQRVSFAVGAYDPSRELIIDPLFVYSTYLGGSSSDAGNAVAVDSTGNAYVAGLASSIDFPTVSPIQESQRGSSSAFVAKFNADGSALVYSTYLGGSVSDAASAIAVDSDGNTYVSGFTESPDFPTVNAFQGSKPGSGAAFVSKLNPAGNALIYSTYLGGSESSVRLGGAGAGSTQSYAIAVDSGGNAYVTGYTTATNFPLAHAFQGSNRSEFNAFVTKFNAAGSALVYSTYLGGSGVDLATGIAVDSDGEAYVTGHTASTDFPTAGAFQGSLQGEQSAFVTKLSSTGGSLVYSTYLGGSESLNLPGAAAAAGDTAANAIALDSAGNAYIAGFTSSSNFPTVDPYQATNRAKNGVTGSTVYTGVNAFISKLNATGSALVYST